MSGQNTIFMSPGISYLSGWVENWFVSVKSSEMMKSTGEWNWKVCLGWIFGDQEEGIWGWFRFFFLMCVAFANIKLNLNISINGFI